MTWLATHLLDPYRSIGRIAPGHTVGAAPPPLEIDVVALDWKWLFIYPQYGIASVNELAAPVDRPLDFHITSASVMNSFYIPALAGQIYAMAGMETRLHAVMNKPGNYKGFSANYSGAGFSGMHFAFQGLGDVDFSAWVAAIKAESGALNRSAYDDLRQPSENVPPRHFATIDSTLYQAILNMCEQPGTTCMNMMRDLDAKNGGMPAGMPMPMTDDKAVQDTRPMSHP